MPVIVNGSTGITTPASNTTGTQTVTTLSSPAATALTIQSGGTTAMTVSTGLSVGIGTTTPTQKLDVFSNSASYSTITARNTVSGFNFAIAGTGDAQVTQTGAYSLQFATNNTEQMRIDANGNMGIGTASPGAKLEVYGTQGGITNPINGSINAVDTTTAALGVGGQIVFKGQYTSGSYTQYGAITAYKESATVDGSQYGAALVFNTRTQGGNNTEKMRIDSSGNLQFNSGYGSVAVAYGCRAWVNFNGTGTVAIRGSGNVSSITDNGTGDYTVNFTTAMPDTNYAVITGASTNSDPGAGGGFNMTTKGSATQTTTSTRQLAGVQNAAYDVYYCFVAIFR